MKICPECKYERTIQDNLLFPAYECPACGIIFEKDKAKQELAELERQREKERKAKREKLKKEEEKKKRLEEERLRQEEEEAQRLRQLKEEKIRLEEARKKKEEAERLHAEEQQRLAKEEEQRRLEEEDRKRKQELESKRIKQETERIRLERQQEIARLAKAGRDRIITKAENARDYHLYDMCPFAIAQAGKGLSIAVFGETRNKWRHGRCMQQYCRLWTLKTEENDAIYAQGCALQFIGLNKEEIKKNIALKNARILEDAYPEVEPDKNGEDPA